MFDRLKHQWQDLARAKPGRRFRTRYYQRRNRRSTGLIKALYLVIGAALVVLGVIMLPAPGPGFLVILVGGSMMAQESLVLARTLDHTERRLRELASSSWSAWRHASAALRALLVAAGAMFAAAAGWAAFALLLH